MKMKVQLAVVLATLLLLTGAAFAGGGDCYFYEVNWHSVSVPDAPIEIGCMQLCFELGTIAGVCGVTDLAFFFDTMKEQALAYGGGGVVHLKFHGDHQYVVAGEGECGTNLYIFRGHKVESCNGG